VIESVDGVPTDQTFQVFDDLHAQLQTQLKNLRDTVGADVSSFSPLRHHLARTHSVHRNVKTRHGTGGSV